MSFTDPFIQVSDELKRIIDDEFSSEGFEAMRDELHESVGHKGTRIGISIEEQNPQNDNLLVLDTVVKVQFYARYNLKVDPDQRVDPATITGYAERFRRALNEANSFGSEYVWFYNLDSLTFPRDPTGNKTRFEAILVAKGNNSGVVETTG